MRCEQIGFTILDLVVVLAIGVATLAMVPPVIARVATSAKMTECRARLYRVGSGVSQYAQDHDNHYPSRRWQGGAALAWITPMTVVRPRASYDMRAGLRNYMSVSKVMNCPFTTQIDLDDSPEDVVVDSSYVMFWGWRYVLGGNELAAMHKINQSFEWDGKRYSVLAGDLDLQYGGNGRSHQASHPDEEDGKLTKTVANDLEMFGERVRLSRFIDKTMSRGKIDTNWVMQNLSVQTYEDVGPVTLPIEQRHSKMGVVPVQWDQRRNGDWLQIPMN